MYKDKMGDYNKVWVCAKLPAFLGNDLQEPSPLAWMYLVNFSSSSAVHLPLLSPTFSQHGALPIPQLSLYLTHTTETNQGQKPTMPEIFTYTYIHIYIYIYSPAQNNFFCGIFDLGIATARIVWIGVKYKYIYI